MTYTVQSGHYFYNTTLYHTVDTIYYYIMSLISVWYLNRRDALAQYFARTLYIVPSNLSFGSVL